MKANALRLCAVVISLSPLAFSQIGSAPSHGELPLLSILGAGILTGGMLSLLKTRHQK